MTVQVLTGACCCDVTPEPECPTPGQCATTYACLLSFDLTVVRSFPDQTERYVLTDGVFEIREVASGQRWTNVFLPPTAQQGTLEISVDGGPPCVEDLAAFPNWQPVSITLQCFAVSVPQSQFGFYDGSVAVAGTPQSTGNPPCTDGLGLLLGSTICVLPDGPTLCPDTPAYAGALNEGQCGTVPFGILSQTLDAFSMEVT